MLGGLNLKPTFESKYDFSLYRPVVLKGRLLQLLQKVVVNAFDKQIFHAKALL